MSLDARDVTCLSFLVDALIAAPASYEKFIKDARKTVYMHSGKPVMPDPMLYEVLDRLKLAFDKADSLAGVEDFLREAAERDSRDEAGRIAYAFMKGTKAAQQSRRKRRDEEYERGVKAVAKHQQDLDHDARVDAWFAERKADREEHDRRNKDFVKELRKASEARRRKS